MPIPMSWELFEPLETGGVVVCVAEDVVEVRMELPLDVDDGAVVDVLAMLPSANRLAPYSTGSH